MLIENLFDKNSNLHGVNYVGEDNFLYQYDQETGLYYYDSSKNAASYNKSDNRFYVYDYIVGTSKSFKEGENKSDFLPFNYMSKEDVEKNKNFASGNGSVNYWFGLKTDISFNLIEKPGTIEQNGEYSNKDGRGNDMIFKFSGDDDVFVFIDDKLVLDLGGLHDVVYGEINFSSGKITIAQNGAKIDHTKIGGYGYDLSDASDDSKIQQYDLKDISSGTHKLSFYYIERGASRANLALYFNISDVYDKPGNIEIKRDLSSHEPDVEHEFIMTLSDETITGLYGDLTFNKGVSKFGLKGGESVIVRE